MENLFRIVGICVVASLLALWFRKDNAIFSLFIICALVIAAAAALLPQVRELIAFIRRVMEITALSSEIFSPLLKVVAISVVTKIGGALCHESESDTAEALVEMGGTCCALVAALPLFELALDWMEKLI